MWKSYFAVLLFGSNLIAQNNLTVTASRPMNAAVDLVVLSVDVLTPITAGRDDVFAAVQGSIATPANFNTVRTSYQYLPDGTTSNLIDWSFLVTAPIGNFKTTVTQLQALQQAVAGNRRG